MVVRSAVGTEHSIQPRTAYNRAHRAIVKDDRVHPSWDAMRAAKNLYHGAIRREKRAHWWEYITTLPRGNLWKAAKYALDPTGTSSSTLCTPNLCERRQHHRVHSGPESEALPLEVLPARARHPPSTRNCPSHPECMPDLYG